MGYNGSYTNQMQFSQALNQTMVIQSYCIVSEIVRSLSLQLDSQFKKVVHLMVYYRNRIPMLPWKANCLYQTCSAPLIIVFCQLCHQSSQDFSKTDRYLAFSPLNPLFTDASCNQCSMGQQYLIDVYNVLVWLKFQWLIFLPDPNTSYFVGCCFIFQLSQWVEWGLELQ